MADTEMGGSDHQYTNTSTESPVTLMAPRPIRPRRHQKSIISLDNFFTGNSGGSENTNTGYNATTGHGGYHNNAGIYHQEPPSAGDSFTDEIPFPSVSPHASTTSPSNGEWSNHASFMNSPRSSLSYHHHLQPNSITSQMLGGSGHVRTRSISTATAAAGSRSRKSSLMESWEVQSIRLSGSKMIGETDVAVYMPTTEIESTTPLVEHTMPLYSPIPDAVDELFQIMKHTSLSVTNAAVVSPTRSSTPPSSRNKLALGIDNSNYGQQQYCNMVPPSPVARTTRNPIILNTAFQDTQQHFHF